jgi:hypothetical protein
VFAFAIDRKGKHTQKHDPDKEKHKHKIKFDIYLKRKSTSNTNNSIRVPANHKHIQEKHSPCRGM